MGDLRKKKKIRARLSPTQFIALTFAVIILIGTLLLMLPVASRDGKSAGLLTSLFTATSGTCVTGLSLVDTWTQWSGFGQTVLLYSCLENPMDKGAWWATVHGVAKSWTRLSV